MSQGRPAASAAERVTPTPPSVSRQVALGQTSPAVGCGKHPGLVHPSPPCEWAPVLALLTGTTVFALLLLAPIARAFVSLRHARAMGAAAALCISTAAQSELARGGEQHLDPDGRTLPC